MLNLTRVRDVLLACLLCASSSLFAQSLSITIAPPLLPVYEQLPCPGDGVFMGPRLLGLRGGRLFLGPRLLDCGASAGVPLDSRLLGLRRRRLHLARRLLGAPRRI